MKYMFHIHLRYVIGLTVLKQTISATRTPAELVENQNDVSFKNSTKTSNEDGKREPENKSSIGNDDEADGVELVSASKPKRRPENGNGPQMEVSEGTMIYTPDPTRIQSDLVLSTKSANQLQREREQEEASRQKEESERKRSEAERVAKQREIRKLNVKKLENLVKAMEDRYSKAVVAPSTISEGHIRTCKIIASAGEKVNDSF